VWVRGWVPNSSHIGLTNERLIALGRDELNANQPFRGRDGDTVHQVFALSGRADVELEVVNFEQDVSGRPYIRRMGKAPSAEDWTDPSKLGLEARLGNDIFAIIIDMNLPNLKSDTRSLCLREDRCADFCGSRIQPAYEGRLEADWNEADVVKSWFEFRAAA